MLRAGVALSTVFPSPRPPAAHLGTGPRPRSRLIHQPVRQKWRHYITQGQNLETHPSSRDEVMSESGTPPPPPLIDFLSSHIQPALCRQVIQGFGLRPPGGALLKKNRFLCRWLFRIIDWGMKLALALALK